MFNKQTLIKYFSMLTDSCVSKMTDQWICIEFYIENNINYSEVIQMLAKFDKKKYLV